MMVVCLLQRWPQMLSMQVKIPFPLYTGHKKIRLKTSLLKFSTLLKKNCFLCYVYVFVDPCLRVLTMVCMSHFTDFSSKDSRISLCTKSQFTANKTKMTHFCQKLLVLMKKWLTLFINNVSLLCSYTYHTQHRAKSNTKFQCQNHFHDLQPFTFIACEQVFSDFFTLQCFEEKSMMRDKHTIVNILSQGSMIIYT